MYNTMDNPQNPGLVETGHVYINRHPFFKYFSYIRTVFGIVTVFVIWSSALESLISVTGIPMSIYLGFIGIPVFLLEFGKVIRYCFGAFRLVLEFDRWKRGIFYAVMSVPCFFPSIANTMSKVSGLMLFICGVFYVSKIFQKKKVPTYISDPNQANVGSEHSFGQP